MYYKGSHQVVRRRSPVRRFFMLMLTLLLTGWASYTLFDLGRKRAGYDSTSAQKHADVMEGQLSQLQKENKQLRERLAFVEQGKAIDHQAYSKVEGNLKALNDELADLKQKLSFYQSIVSPEDDTIGVRVQTLRLAAIKKNAGTYRYKLIVIQGPAKAKRARGKIVIDVKGQQNGRDTTLSFEEISGGKLSNLKYDFMYYQNFQGELAFPEGFQPAKVIVKVQPRESDNQANESTFEWREVAT